MTPNTVDYPAVYCDRCPTARAKSVAMMPSGLTLTFCGHCTMKHLSALLASGAISEPLPGETLDWGQTK